MNRIKKITMILFLCTVLVGCGNRNIFTVESNFKYAQVKLPDGQIKAGKIVEWSNSEHSDLIQIKFENGEVLLVHSSQAVLFSEQPK